jgi:hypothetical protein
VQRYLYGVLYKVKQKGAQLMGEVEKGPKIAYQ